MGSFLRSVKLMQANIRVDGVIRNLKSHLVLRVRPRERGNPINYLIKARSRNLMPATKLDLVKPIQSLITSLS